MERVLITGVGGQVGSYLAEMLLGEGHAVVGLESGARLPEGVERAQGSLEPGGIVPLLTDNGPLTAVVHLASVTSMTRSWEEPLRTFDLNGRAGAALAFTLAERPGVRLIHASSAEIFGRTSVPVQNELTAIDPVSPYGIAKAAAHMAVRLVREARGVAASNVVLYLAESPRRPPTFVLRKITRSVAAIVCGDAREIVLGNTDAVRDFTHARDVAAAMKLLACGAAPGDYVCSSGQGRSIREVCETACRLAGVDPAGRIVVDPALLRPSDIPSLVGDNRALRALGWQPRTSFEELLRELIDHDLAEHRRARP